MTAPTALSAPIDDDDLVRRVVAAALAAERHPLLDTELSGPGGYLFFLSPNVPGSGDPLALLGEWVMGSRPIYAGAAADLGGRMRRYRSPHSFAGAAGLPIERIWVAAVPTRSLAGALLVEQTAISTWRPPFNDALLSGAGSRHQGRQRIAGQRPQPFGRLFRRPWETAASPAEVAATHLALAVRVITPPDDAPSWSALPARPASAGGHRRPGTRRPSTR